MSPKTVPSEWQYLRNLLRYSTKLKNYSKLTQAKQHHISIMSKTENLKTGLMVLQSLLNISENCPERIAFNFEEHTSIQRKLKKQSKSTQAKPRYISIISKTENFKRGLMVLQSLQNVSEHFPEQIAIHLEEHTSIQKKVKKQSKSTQAKPRYISIISETENLKTGLMVLQSLQNVSDNCQERMAIHFEEPIPIQNKIAKLFEANTCKTPSHFNN